MSAWVVAAIAFALAAAFLWGWIAEHNAVKPCKPAPGELKLVADFDEKKKAEAARIDAESPNSLLNDLNRR